MHTHTGKNKLIVNNLEKLFITNDAATIIQEMDVIHPAAKLIVMATEQQRKEVGDGSNLVCVLAGEFLNQADELLRMGLHATDITEAYSRASKKALELLESACPAPSFAPTRRLPSAIAGASHASMVCPLARLPG